MPASSSSTNVFSSPSIYLHSPLWSIHFAWFLHCLVYFSVS
jgi:hypothetical protein